jgi:hypothetical protein
MYPKCKSTASLRHIISLPPPPSIHPNPDLIKHDVVNVSKCDMEKKKERGGKKVSTRSRKQGYLCTSHIPDHYIHYIFGPLSFAFVFFCPITSRFICLYARRKSSVEVEVYGREQW